jgi:hypothetical protein
MNQSTQLRDLEEHDSNFYQYEPLTFLHELNTRGISQSTFCIPRSFKTLCDFDIEKYLPI